MSAATTTEPTPAAMEKPELEHQESFSKEEEEPRIKPPVVQGADLASTDLSTYVPGGEAEKKLLRKVDYRLFPCVWLMYFMNYLDRTNIGNAKVAGLMDDLNMTDNQYSIALLIFFVGYLLGEVPSNMILSRLRPSIYLPSIVLLWGSVATIMSCMQNFGGLVALRVILGLIESGFFPGVLFLISAWYRKHELSKRTALLYCAAILSGAFGGLLAGGIIESMENVHGLRGWRWLFIIEGGMTVGISIAVFFILPDWPATSKFLSDEEKLLATQRIAADHVGIEHEHISHTEALRAAFSNWQLYTFMLLYALVVGAGTISYFLPTLTTSLGYEGRDAHMTIPIYIVAALFSLATSFSADYFKERPLHISGPAMIGVVCFAINAGITNFTGRYVLVVFGASGIWSSLPVILAWVSNTVSYPSEVKAITQAMVNGVGNLASIYGAYIWPSSSAPQYIPGNAATAGFLFGVVCLAALNKYLTNRFPYHYDYAAHRSRAPLHA